MKKNINIVFYVFILIFSCAFVQKNLMHKDCSMLHEGTFVYQSDDGKVKVLFNGKKHVEYHNQGKYFIKSSIKWVNDCEYNTILKEVTLPDFPFKKGTIMNVKIDKVDGETVFYTSMINGIPFEGKLTKVK